MLDYTLFFFIRTFFIGTLRMRFDQKFKNVWDEIKTSLGSAKFYKNQESILVFTQNAPTTPRLNEMM